MNIKIIGLLQQKTMLIARDPIGIELQVGGIGEPPFKLQHNKSVLVKCASRSMQ